MERESKRERKKRHIVGMKDREKDNEREGER
jgi:hypothetical protein